MDQEYVFLFPISLDDIKENGRIILREDDLIFSYDFSGSYEGIFSKRPVIIESSADELILSG